MLTPSLKNSVQIRIADGGYIITWMEPRTLPPHSRAHEEKQKEEEEEKPAYLEEEERRMTRGSRPWYYANPARFLESKVAVRVDLAAALELIGQILGRLGKLEKDAAEGH